MRHCTGYGVTDKKLKVRLLGVTSIVISQVGGAYSVLVDNVIRTMRGASTVSGNDGQTFLEKIPAPNVEIFFQFCPAWI